MYICCFPLSAYAEDVIFVVPGSSDQRSVIDFDPQLQKIAIGESITFVNADGVDHHLVVRSADSREVFDSGLLAQNQFVSHTFSGSGEYTLQCRIYSHMRGEITVTDDIATFTKTIDLQYLDVQLTRVPANPGINEEIYYKITFIDKETGKNHPHIDFTLTFNDSSANFVDGVGGHTTDGQEIAVFKFDKEDIFTPIVTVSGISFIPIAPERVTFDTMITPEFPVGIIGIMMAVTIGVIILSQKLRQLYPGLG
jgi:plastocyanin